HRAQTPWPRRDPRPADPIGQETPPDQQPVAKMGSGDCPAPWAQQSGRGRGAQAVRGGVARDARPRHRRDRAIRHLHTKLHKLATDLGVPAIKALGYETKEALVQKKLYLLRNCP